MKKVRAGFNSLIVAILCAGCATMFTGSREVPSEAKAIQGNWRPAKAVLSGEPMADAVLKIISLKMDDGRYEVFVGGNPDRGTSTLDPATELKAMNVTGTEGPNVGKTFPAIYELNGDTLRICYDLSGVNRPAEFKSMAGTKLYLVTYNRY